MEIGKIADNMTKADEIRILEKLHEVFCLKHPGNYLSTLFTTGFVTWASNQIKNDFTVNAMEYISDYYKDKELKIARKKVVELDIIVSDQAQRLIEVQKLNTEQQNNLSFAIGDLELDLAVRNSEVQALNTHLRVLKARVYDLEHPVNVPAPNRISKWTSLLIASRCQKGGTYREE